MHRYVLAAITTLAIVLSSSCASSFPIVERPTSQLLLDGMKSESEGNESDDMLLPDRALTPAGLALLKTNEGEVRCKRDSSLHCPYNDSSRFCTIGHGHLIARKSCEAIRDKLLALGYLDGISDADAEALLVSDLAIAQVAIEKHSDSLGAIGRASLTPMQYDALVSFVFNVGVPNFDGSTLLTKIRERADSSGSVQIAYQFSRWRKSSGAIVPGLINRRRREVQHFFNGFVEPFVDWEGVAQESGSAETDATYLDIAKGER